MWILPRNHKLSSAYAPEAWGLKEELNARQGKNFTLPLMWRSKPLSLKTWSSKWREVLWLRHLFGRMLKPSLTEDFTKKYTASLPVIHASRSASRGKSEAQKINGTFGLIYLKSLKQLNLFGAFSKTSLGILTLDSTKWQDAFKNWAIQLKQDCLQRKKLARPRPGSGCSSTHNWATPTVMGNKRRHVQGLKWEKVRFIGTNGERYQIDLRQQVIMNGGQPEEELRMFGNAVVEQQAELAFKTLFNKINQL